MKKLLASQRLEAVGQGGFAEKFSSPALRAGRSVGSIRISGFAHLLPLGVERGLSALR